MSRQRDRKQSRYRIRRRYRHSLRGSADRPRLAVYRSLRHIYAQLIDDEAGRTLVAASSLEKVVAGGVSHTGNADSAALVGKAIAERAKETGMETVIIRPGLIPFGRFDRLFSLPFVRLVQRGFVPMVNGGRARINTAYAGNLVQGLLLAITHPAAANQTFILADPPVTFRELAAEFSKALGKRAVPIPIPSGPVAVAGRVMESLPLPFAPPITRYRARVVAEDSWFSTKKAERLLGYKARVPLDEAVRQTVKWAAAVDR